MKSVARPAREAQGGGDEQELPPPFRLTGLHEFLKLEAVRADHAHGGYLERVDRIGHALDPGGHGLPVAVREKRRHVAFVQQGDRAHVSPARPSPS